MFCRKGVGQSISKNLYGSQKMLNSLHNSLLPLKNSLLGMQKFPAPLRREFCCKPLDSLAEWRRKLANEPKIFKNSLQIPWTAPLG